MLRLTVDNLSLRLGIALALVCLAIPSAEAGPYLDSAHGNSDYGVNRTAFDGTFANYATGNCAHCHEAHASIEGAETGPASGPAAHALFAPSFNIARTLSPYLETDDFCFYCHSDTSGQQVVNRDYSTTFGGGDSGSGPQSIFAQFNQASYHNLFDIDTFLKASPEYSPWYVDVGNPCSGCHNSHLAKRNWDSAEAGFPLRSTISLPGNTSLWGEAEVMSSYFSYEAPYAVGDTREPASVGDTDGTNTPDYVTFCTACHNQTNTIWSTTLNRNLRPVNWEVSGTTPDKHGTLARTGHPYDFGVSQWIDPYALAENIKTNFVLSCMDCHEAHGSASIMLIRGRVNGDELAALIDDTVDKPLYELCVRCHDDKYINDFHHEPGAIPGNDVCTTCHPNGESDPKVVTCRNCHYHGSHL